MKTVKSPKPVKVNRADALRLAWQLVRNASLSFSDAMKKAWATLRLKAEMLLKPVSFSYHKGDGTKRFAVGDFATATDNVLVVRYFDTLVNNYRSFRIDRLIVD